MASIALTREGSSQKPHCRRVTVPQGQLGHRYSCSSWRVVMPFTLNSSPPICYTLFAKCAIPDLRHSMNSSRFQLDAVPVSIGGSNQIDVPSRESVLAIQSPGDPIAESQPTVVELQSENDTATGTVFPIGSKAGVIVNGHWA